jgi:indolepyruvate ferredoxin oxidoreductase beta subunit
MGTSALPQDPFNLIITGVGGQGNVLASRIVGNMLIRKGLRVTIGETFGASQRGGSVMSHLRVSKDATWSPQIPKGKAHMVVALEPTEAIRVLRDYGNPGVDVLCNMRPIHAISVISGETAYPSEGELKSWLGELSHRAWFVRATEEALRLGSPILGNVILVGALAGTGVLPVDRMAFQSVIERTMDTAKVAMNLAAFDRGAEMVGDGA